MNFLNPIYLFALAAVAVPILIHIFSRRRVPEIPFSTIRFLRRSDRRSMVRINLRRLLLLALRVLGVALLVLFFARPVVRGGLAALFPASGSRAACVLLDRSYSMGLEGDGGTSFARAKARIASLLDSFKREDAFSLVLFDTTPEVRYEGEFDRSVALDALKETKPSWSGTDLRSAVAFGRKILRESRRDTRELYVISDFQKTAIAGRTRPAGEEAPEVAYPIRAILLPIQGTAVSNVAIEEVLTPRVMLHKGEVAELGVVLRNASRDLPARFPLEISIGGRPVMEKEIEIPPDSYHTETLVFPAERTGWVEGYVKKRVDRLAADDVRYFTLHVQEKRHVLLIADEGSLYLEQALNPYGSEGDIAVASRGWRSFASRDLDSSEEVILGPGRGPQGSDIDLIDRFVSSGGKAVVLLLPELKTAAQRLSRFPLRFEFAEMPHGYFSIEKPQRPPYFLAPFGEEDIASLSSLRFRSAAIVGGVPAKASLLRFTSGNPFVWEERRGEGMVVFAAIDPRPEAGELVLSPYFLPLIQQLVLATGAREPSVAGSYVGEPIAWNGNATGDVICQLPDGTTLKPDRVDAGSRGAGTPSIGSGRAAGGGLMGSGFRVDGGAGSTAGRPAREERAPGLGAGLLIPPVEAPGFVSLHAGSELRGIIAVNPDCREESDIAFMSASAAADSLGLSTSRVIGEAEDVTAALRSAREGKEISVPLLLAAMVVFMVEVVIAQREKGETS
jgi:hypothetical protein